MGTGFIDHVTAFSSRTPNQEDRIGQFKTHRHPEAEITLLIKGEGYYASGEQNARVSAGNMILIPSAAPHSYVCIKHWEGYSLHLHELEMPAYPQYLFQQAFSQRTGPILKARLTGVHLERAAGAMKQLAQECREPSSEEFLPDLLRNSLETLLLAFHVCAVDSAAAEPSGDTGEEQLIKDAIKQIHQQYHTSLKVSDLAASHYLSESIFRKKFSERTGLSPKQYMISLRLQEAKRLLRLSAKPVEFIASEVGFSSSSRFHDLFVKNVGMTPLEWRKEGQ